MLHVGHMEYVLAGKARCEHLIIGITNPDISDLYACAANPHRATACGNPLTYEERRDMIVGALIEAGVPAKDFEVIRFPIGKIECTAENDSKAAEEMLTEIVPTEVKFYMTIYDSWSLEKKALFEKLGRTVEVMWERDNDEKTTSGTEVRNRIIKGEPWEELVPPFVYRYVKEHGLEERIIAAASCC